MKAAERRAVLPMPRIRVRTDLAKQLRNPRVRRFFVEALVRQDVVDGTVDDELLDAALAYLAPQLPEDRRRLWYGELARWWEQRKFAEDTRAPRYDVVDVDLNARLNEALRELGVA
jgi:hypothetical protein